MGTRWLQMVFAVAISCTSAEVGHAETDGTDPPEEYCRLTDQYEAIEAQAAERFPDTGTDDKWLARKNWVIEQSEKADDEFSEAYGKSYREWFTIAFENHWTQACEAAKSGWVTIRKEAATSITNAHVQRVKDAVTLEYLTRLQSGDADRFFDAERYSAVNCADAHVGGFTFVGCRLRSISYQTDRDIFLVADKAGTPVAVPYTSEARDRVAQQRTIGEGGYSIALGHYVGELPLVEYSELVAALN